MVCARKSNTPHLDKDQTGHPWCPSALRRTCFPKECSSWGTSIKYQGKGFHIDSRWKLFKLIKPRLGSAKTIQHHKRRGYTELATERECLRFSDAAASDRPGHPLLESRKRARSLWDSPGPHGKVQGLTCSLFAYLFLSKTEPRPSHLKSLGHHDLQRHQTPHVIAKYPWASHILVALLMGEEGNPLVFQIK